jgi:hypothetical protein
MWRSIINKKKINGSNGISNSKYDAKKLDEYDSKTAKKLIDEGRAIMERSMNR